MTAWSFSPLSLLILHVLGLIDAFACWCSELLVRICDEAEALVTVTCDAADAELMMLLLQMMLMLLMLLMLLMV